MSGATRALSQPSSGGRGMSRGGAVPGAGPLRRTRRRAGRCRVPPSIGRPGIYVLELFCYKVFASCNGTIIINKKVCVCMLVTSSRRNNSTDLDVI